MGNVKSKEPDLDLTGVEYVVVDTNFGPHGFPDQPRLEQLASAAEPAGILVGVPEIVVWEWAEHLHGRVSAVYQAAKQANGSLAKGGLGTLAVDPVAESAREIADNLAEAVRQTPNVIVIPASEGNALHALRDQILQQGAGIRKTEVKTGAADSSWIRDAIDLVEGDTSRLVFVSENRSDIVLVCDLLGKPTPQSGAFWPVKGSLGSVVPTESTSDDVVALRTYVRSVLPQSVRGGMHGDVPDTDIPVWMWTVEDANVESLPEGAVVQSLEILRLNELVAMNDEEETTSSQSPSVRARFTFLGDVDVDYYVLDVNGEVQSASETISDALIWVDLEFSKKDQTWSYESSYDVYVDDTADLEFADDGPDFGYDESSDHLDEVAATLSQYFSELPEDWPIEGEPEHHVVRQGIDVYLSFGGDRFGDWTLDIQVGELSAHVASTYNPDTYVWAGKDGFHSRPPYEPSFSANGINTAGYLSLDSWLGAVLPKRKSPPETNEDKSGD